MLRHLLALALVLAAPSVARAGHVESDVLRAGDVKTWWKNNKEAVLAGFRTEARKPDLERVLAEQPQLRMTCVWAAYLVVATPPAAARAATWRDAGAHRAEVALLAKRYDALYRDYQRRPAHYVGLSAREFLEAVTSAYSDKNSRDRLKGFYDREDVQEAILAQVGGGMITPRRASEKAVVDLSMLLVLLDVKNKAFFMNGYSHDAINAGSDYAGIYSKFAWTERNVQAARDEIRKVLVEIGKPGLETMVGVWEDFREVARSRDAMTLGLSSLAREFNWSTKDTRFPTPTHRAFKQDFVEIATAVAPGTAPFEGLSAPPAPKPVDPPRDEHRPREMK